MRGALLKASRNVQKADDNKGCHPRWARRAYFEDNLQQQLFAMQFILLGISVVAKSACVTANVLLHSGNTYCK